MSSGLFLLGVTAVSGWSCDGHMSVAQIALDSGIMSSATIMAANELVSFLDPQYPYTGPSFQETACWADDIRSKEPDTAGWHYIDLPVCRLKTGSCPQPNSTNNAVWAINNAEGTLESSAAAKLDKARMLRFLIHFVGDVHQPLHAADYFSSQFPPPDGDRGGNSWDIAGALPSTELHAYWDGGLGQWTSNLHRPLNSTGTQWLEDMSAKVRALYPASSLSKYLAVTNASAWALESFTIADTFVYTAPQAPTPIPASYTSQGQQIVLKQLAIAGYRLADAL